MSFKKILVVLLTISLLTACSDGENIGDGIVTTEDGVTQDGSQGTGNNYGANGGFESGDLGNYAAGSQDDLVANIGDRVFFDFNSAQITTLSSQTLKRQAQWLIQHPSITITIEGHCDERGTREYNLALGEKRANSVKNYLISQGVESSRIKTISYGKEHPEYLGSNEAAWSKNRRGVTVVN